MAKRTNTAVWMKNQNRWQINVQKDGVRRSFTSSKPGRTGQREANAKADAWLDEGLETNIRVDKLYAEYIESVRAKTSEENYSKLERDGRNHIIPVIGHLKINKLSEYHLQEVIDKAAEKGLSKKTLKNIKDALSGFLKYSRRKKATTLTTEFVDIPKSAPAKEKHILQPADFEILFSSDLSTWRTKVVHDDLINAYRLQALTGLRPGELIGLEWADVTATALHIKRSVNKQGKITKGKNENAVRSVALSELALKVIDDQRKKTKVHTGRVFDIPSQFFYWQNWKRYKEYNKISDVTPYELRHTFVSIAKILPEGQVKGLVGHSRNMDTFGIYGHEISGEQQEIANSLNKAFSKILKNNTDESEPNK